MKKIVNFIKENLFAIFLLLFIVCVIISSFFTEQQVIQQQVNKCDSVRQELKDSITIIKCKENEDIVIIKNADADSTIAIFKRLIRE